MALRAFTRPDGIRVLIHPDNVSEVRTADSAVGDPPRARSVIVLMSGGFQAVRETLEEAQELLK